VAAERAWSTATRISAWIVAALFAILLVSGVVLTFRYRPTVAYADVRGLEHHPMFTARRIHRAASQLFLLAVSAFAFSTIGLFFARRERTRVVWPLAAAGLSLLAAFTGYLLPWDQLGLWAVTVGTNVEGYRPILRGHGVKFVLFGTNEVSTETLSRWYWAHAVVVPLLLAAAVVVVVWRARRQPTRV
jgi:quinol-cytochrome oxidoreductase complex cytochrome b subunit